MCTTNQSATVSDDHDDPLTSEQKRVSYGKNTVDPEEQILSVVRFLQQNHFCWHW